MLMRIVRGPSVSTKMDKSLDLPIVHSSRKKNPEIQEMKSLTPALEVHIPAIRPSTLMDLVGRVGRTKTGEVFVADRFEQVLELGNVLNPLQTRLLNGCENSRVL